MYDRKANIAANKTLFRTLEKEEVEGDVIVLVRNGNQYELYESDGESLKHSTCCSTSNESLLSIFYPTLTMFFAGYYHFQSECEWYCTDTYDLIEDYDVSSLREENYPQMPSRYKEALEVPEEIEPKSD